MAYATKYQFSFFSGNGVYYLVDILKDGYTGAPIERKLGKTPVIRMQDSDPFRPTSCNLVLECAVDGEFAELYTSNPFQYRVDIYRGGSPVELGYKIWTGFVATEIYAEPDIAPPYDVSITATDGLGILKEYDFEPVGALTVRAHLINLLSKTGLDLDMVTASSLREYGETAVAFLDGAKINIDYMEGETCYDVLKALLETLHATITQCRGEWLIVRETDATVSSGGAISVISSDTDPTSTSAVVSMSGAWATVGQMGVADMWPVGYMTRRVVPAKKSVVVEAPWHKVDMAPLVSADGWTHGPNYCTFDTNHYFLGQPGNANLEGYVYTIFHLFRFTSDVRVTLRAARAYSNRDWMDSKVSVGAQWLSGATGNIYYHAGTGWTSTSPSEGERKSPQQTCESNDPNDAEEMTFIIPSAGDNNIGVLKITVSGNPVKVYDIKVEMVLNGGYRDTILLNNGARGTAPDVELSAGRLTLDNFISIDAMQGIFYVTPDANTTRPLVAFSDKDNTNLDYLSVSALSYAKSVAAPRIELSGTLDVPRSLTFLPSFVQAHSMDHQLVSYDWDLLNDNLNFKAISLPSATLSVTSETVTSLPNN